MGIWVVNAFLQNTLDWLYKNNFRVERFIDAVKLTSTGKVMKSNGHFLQHGKEMLILATKGDKRLERCTDLVLKRKGWMNAKPQVVTQMISELSTKADLNSV